jgi:hypothetical protein
VEGAPAADNGDATKRRFCRLNRRRHG